jgi:hypothetical protein
VGGADRSVEARRLEPERVLSTGLGGDFRRAVRRRAPRRLRITPARHRLRVIPISPTVQQLLFEQRCVTQTRHSGRSDREREPEALDRSELGGRGQWDGGERGIRTQEDFLNSVSCRFHNAAVAKNARVAVAPCTLLHARPRLHAVSVRRTSQVQIAGSPCTKSASLLDSSLGPYLLLFSMEMPNVRSTLGRRPALS